MKRCGKCGETKPHSEFYKDKRARDGLMSYCKECAKAAARAWYETKYPDKVKKTAERKALAEQGQKPCSGCDEVKPVDEFGKNKSTSDGLQDYCRTCSYARTRASRKKNPEKYRAEARKGSAVRRARKAGMKVFDISPKDRRSLDLGACAHAHLGECDGVITEDHVIPVSKPGSIHGIGNLQAMCWSHNSRKHGKWEVEARYAPELAALKARKRALVQEAA